MTIRNPSPGRLGRVLGVISALPLALIVALTFIDVFARYFFAHPVPGASEIIQFSMALAIFTALPLVTQAGGHITLDFFTYKLGMRKKALLQLVCELLSGLALAVIAWRLWIQAGEYIDSQTTTIVLGLHMAPLGYAMAVFAALSVIAVGLRFTEALLTVLAPAETAQ